jgi:glycosyltransferase involved in cell wall biosynthesis
MRILICSSAAPLPPLVDGLRVQISALHARLREEHDVRVLALSRPDQGPSPGDEMVLVPAPAERGRRAKVVPTASALLARRPIGVRELSMPLRKPLRAELERFRPDVVHVTGESLAPLVDELRGTPSVLAALDAMHLNLEATAKTAGALARPVWLLDARNMRRFEATVFRHFGRVVVVSHEDAEALREIDPTLAVTTIPNGVEAELYSPDPAVSRERDLILFTGVMDWPPNVLAAQLLARSVMPRVRAEHPHARLAIVGRNPSPAVLALDRLPGVQVVGPVSEMRPWLSRARAYACPMTSGTGIKNKLLEALANGVATVAAPLALRGLRVESGRELLIGRDEDELATQLAAILADDELAASLGEAARAYVKQHHDWDGVARAYTAVYREVASMTSSATVTT